MALAPQTRLGQYEIVEAIGAGGMGEVYRARDTKLGREVAVKVLPEELSHDRERLQRFEREAKLLASLNHNNIATLYGLEELGGRQFLVMELVEGETLAERIARGPIPVLEALPLFRQIAEALEAAHEKGIIHRDLKPANIQVTPDGTVKVLDFGLAKAVVEDGVVIDISQSPTMTREGTQAGVLLGTAPYMSPEQARGKPVDHRADIWAFGCVSFEALTGKTCFLGETVTDTLAAVVRAEPDWTALPGTTPVRLRDLLSRCLSKDPRQRIQHAGDVRIALTDALDDPTGPLAVQDVRRGRLSLVAALALGALSTWVVMRTPAPLAKNVTRTVLPLEPAEELVMNVAPSVAISPDGRTIAYVARRGETTGLYLRRLEALEAELVDGTDGAAAPFFSPDGMWVGFSCNRSIMRVPVRGGAPISVVEFGGVARGASWSPNGDIIFSWLASGEGLTAVPADGGRRESLTRLDVESGEKSHRFADVLPGGKSILFTRGSNDMATWDDASIGVLEVETGRRQILVEGGSNARFSPTGHIVYARGGSLLAVAFDPDTLRVAGVPVTVLDGVAYSPIMGQAEYGLSRDGTLVYAPGETWGHNNRLVWVDRRGDVEPVIETARAFQFARVSPDGRSLAIVIEGANRSVWRYDLSRGTLTQLAAGRHRGLPVWTPDGQRVAFYSNEREFLEIWWRVADGSADAERLARGDMPYYPCSWTPDGKTLTFVKIDPDTGRDIWALSLSGERSESAVLATEFNEDSPMISPDGHWMAYESDESGRSEIYVRPFPLREGKWQVSTAGGTYPRWNPNGRELFYRQGDKLMAVEVSAERELDLSTPRELFERASPNGGEYDVDVDGQRFIMADSSLAPKPPSHLILVQNWAEEVKRLVPVEH